MTRLLACVLAFLVGLPALAGAETGYDLWLRYPLLPDSTSRAAYRRSITHIVVPLSTPTGQAIGAELQRGVRGLLGEAVPLDTAVRGNGAILVGTPSSVPAIAALGWSERLAELGDDGYVLRQARIGSHLVTVVASQSEVGALYGSFHLLRLMQTGRSLVRIDLAERPRLQRRVLNHWDNLDGSIERGYAGRSLWNWAELPGRVDPRLVDYARANASIGINGTVINSVNAKAESLDASYLAKTAAIAAALRPYGIRVYLSANFAAPKLLGQLPTADPLDPAVARFWRDKADEIYKAIPDFGGWLVKANSEGQPGPQDYGRNHAEGANVLADALAAHGGVVMWRAFVYNQEVDPDRTKRASLEFVPLDGRFRDNVLVQVKNGALDFQPREPFHQLYGALPKTPIMGELQITQEYLGQSTHLVYLAPMWTEFLGADTFAKGPGSLVSQVLDGSVDAYRYTGIAGVANTGSDRNWCGHDFAQANWFAYGRLAWNPSLDAREIADDWIRLTWSVSPDVVAAIRSLMMESREAFVDYTMPLGLHHLIGGDHYAPMPENVDRRRSDWSAVTYHHAAEDGVGYDRTARGSNAVAQYRSPLREQWSDPTTTPEALLLWFHHLPWDYPLPSGGTLWDGLVRRYTRGAAAARDFESRWQALAGKVDPERHAAVLAKLHQQAEDAAAWRDKCLRYFQQFSKRPLTVGSK